MRKPAKILFLLLFPLLTKAQNNPVLATGNIISATISGQKVAFVTEHAHGELTVYSPAVIRVRLDKRKLEKDFSYAVIAKPVETKVSINQNDQEITITTDSLKAKIKKRPYSTTFYTPDDHIPWLQ